MESDEKTATNIITENTQVWISDKDDGFIAASLLTQVDTSDDSEKIHVKLSNGAEQLVNASDISPKNPPNFDRCENMSSLSHLNEATVYTNLRDRFYSNLIYTYSGLFLVAVNPWCRMDDIYSDEVMSKYRGRTREELQPHIYAICNEAYVQMLEHQSNQTILITGESGAGKTFNTRNVIKFFTKTGLIAEGTSNLEEKLLQANPVLESFGNAKTIRNNNSSRFGKFIRVQFDMAGQIVGADIETYLLEKNRVIHHDSSERGFHIFYQLLAGVSAEYRSKYRLLESNQYCFLAGQSEIDGLDNAREFRKTVDSLTTVGVSEQEQAAIWRVLSAVLLLGNLQFYATRTQETANFKESVTVEHLCEMLGVDSREFQECLLRPVIKAGYESVVATITPEKAASSAQALAKTIYERLFRWIVDKINGTLESKASYQNFIGVLDIAGFEIFKTNSFEQLCINLTNEKLQQFFNQRMFVLEQEIYQKEGIEWNFIDFGRDLQPTIDLIEQPMGILSILDEECLFPKATDETFIRKLMQKHSGKHEKFSSVRLAPTSFICKHYAGNVPYETTGWLVKNKDPISETVTQLLSQSSEPLMAGFFKEFSEKKSPTSGNFIPRKKGQQFVTVSQRHRVQLNDLMYQLQKTTPHFVRCLIPNEQKKPGVMDPELVINQLRCNGVLEGIRITRIGFPSRVTFQEFKQRYQLLAPSGVAKYQMDSRQVTLNLLEQFRISADEFRLGKSKVFLKSGTLASLEEQRNARIARTLVGIQACVRGCIIRKRFNSSRSRGAHIKLIQRNVRAYVELRNDAWWSLFTRIKPLLGVYAQERATNALKSKIQELQEQVEALTGEKSDLVRAQEDQKRKWSDETSELSIALEETIEALTRMEDVRTNHVIDIEDLKVTVEQLQDANLVLQRERDAKEAQVQEAKRSVEGLNGKLTDMSAAHRRQFTAFEELRTQMQSEIDEHLLKVASQEKSIAELRRQGELHLEEKAASDKQLMKAGKKIADLEQKLKSAQKELKTSSDVNARSQVSNAELQDSVAKLTASSSQQASELESAQHQIAILKAQNQELVEDLDLKKAELSLALKEVKIRASAMDELQAEIDSLRETESDLLAKLDEKANLNVLERSVEQKKAYETELNSLRSELNKERNNLASQLEEMTLKLEYATKQVLAIKADKAVTEELLADSTAKLEEVQKAKLGLERTLKQRSHDVKSLESSVEALKQAHALLSEESCTEIERLRQEAAAQLEEFGRERKRLANELTSARDLATNHSQQEVDLFKLTVLEKDQRISSMDAEISIAIEKSESLEHQLLESNKKLNDKEFALRKLQKLDEVRAEQDKSIVKLKQTLSALNEDLQVARTRSEFLQRRNAELEAKSESLNAQLLTTIKESHEVSNQYSRHGDELVHLRGSLDLEKAKSHRLATENDSLQLMISDLQLAAEEYADEMAQQREKIRALANELRLAKEDLLNREKDKLDAVVLSKAKVEDSLDKKCAELEVLAHDFEQLKVTLLEKDLLIEQVRQLSKDELLAKEAANLETVRKFEKQLQEKNSSSEDWMHRFEESEKSCERLKEECQSLTDKIALELSEYEDQALQLKQMEDFTKNIQLEFDRAQSQLVASNARKQELELSVQEHSQKIRNLEKELKAASKKETRLLQDVETNSLELLKMCSLLEASELTAEALRSEVAQIKSELSAESQKCHDLERKLFEFEMKVQSQAPDVSAVALAKHRLELDGLNGRIHDLNMALNDSQSAQHILRVDLDRSRNECAKLKQELSNVKSERSGFMEGKRALHSELTELKMKLLSETGNLRSAESKLQQHVLKEAQLAHDLDEAEQSIRALQQELVSKEIVATALSQDLTAEKSETKQLAAKLQSLHADLNLSAREKSALEVSIHELKRDSNDQKEFQDLLQEQSAQISEYERTLAQVERYAAETLQESQEEVARISTELAVLQRQATSHSLEKQELGQKLEQALRNHASLEEKNLALSNRCQFMETSLASIKAASGKSMEQLTSLQAEHSTVLQELETLQNLQSEFEHERQEWQLVKQGLDATIQDLQVSAMKLSQELDEQRELASQTMSERVEMIYEVEMVSRRNVSLQSQLVELQASFDNEAELRYAFEGKSKELGAKAEQLQAQLELAGRSQLEVREATASRYQDKIARLQSKLDELAQENSALLLEKKRLEAETFITKAPAYASNDRTNSRASELTAQLNAANSRTLETQHQLQKSQNELRKVTRLLELEKSMVARLESQRELRQLDSTLSLMESEILNGDDSEPSLLKDSSFDTNNQ